MTSDGSRASPNVQARSKYPRTSAGSTPPETGVRERFTHQQRPSRSRREDARSSLGEREREAEATAAFVRSILCAPSGHAKDRTAPRPIEELLPALTSSNEVDLQLYALIAIVVRDFVYSWYGQLTPDHVFVDELVHIIAHCTRQLEQRWRKVDLESLLLDEIPALVDAHITAYRAAHRPLRPAPLALDPHDAYHALFPHPALSPVPNPLSPATVEQQQHNDSAYRRLLAQGILAVLLPTEELENGCLRTLMEDVLGEMILGNWVGRNAREGRVWWEAIARLAEALHVRVRRPAPPTVSSGAGSMAAGGAGKGDEDSKAVSPSRLAHYAGWTWRPRWLLSHLAGLIGRTIQYAFLALVALRFALIAIVTSSSSSSPARASSDSRWSGRSSRVDVVPPEPTTGSTARPPPPLPVTGAAGRDIGIGGGGGGGGPRKRPILKMKIWSMTGNLVDLSTRMPWLTGLLQLMRHGLIVGPGRVGDTDGILDRLLSHHLIHPYLLDPIPTHLPSLLQTLRTTFYHPQTHQRLPLSSSIPPTTTTTDVKTRCATSLRALLPPLIRTIYLHHPNDDNDTADGDDMINDMLNLLADPYPNQHLLYALIDLLIVRLMPELQDDTVQTLLAARLAVDLDG